MARRQSQPKGKPQPTEDLVEHGHDRGYRGLFLFARMVRDLLTEYVRQSLLRDADLARLERVPNSFIGRRLSKREGDVIWRAPFHGASLYLYFPFEFQSTVQRFMAVRAMQYQSLVFEELIRRKELTDDGNLPPVLVIVLYNGAERWTAPRDVADLVELPAGMEEYRTSVRYVLLDQNVMATDAAPSDNIAAALVKMEKSRTPEELRTAVESLTEVLSIPEDEGLRRTFADWLRMVLLPRRMPGVEMPAVNDLEGVRSMLAERVLEWTEQWKQEGMDQGLKQGMDQGLKQGFKTGESALLLRLMDRKFGPLSERVRQRVASADAETLLMWGDRVLDAARIEDVIR